MACASEQKGNREGAGNSAFQRVSVLFLLLACVAQAAAVSYPVLEVAPDKISLSAALRLCAEAGGCHVTLEGGRVHTAGAFNLTDNMVLEIPSGTTLLASTDPADFPLIAALPSYPISTGKNSSPRYQAFIGSFGVHNISIIGAGTIDMQGQVYWYPAYHNKTLAYTRPRMLEFISSSLITVSGVTLKNSAFWTVHPVYCSDVLISGVTIHNPPATSSNTDGIDPDSSKRVIIEGCTIFTADDHIAIKAGQDTPGYLYNVSTRHVVIRNNHFLVGGGIALGSEVSGGIENVTIANNTMEFSGDAVRMKCCPHYGGGISSLSYTDLDVTLSGVGVFIDQNYECPTPNTSIPNPLFTDIHVRNMNGFVGQAGSMSCFEGGCENFVFEDIQLESILRWRCKNVHGTATNVHPPMDRCLEQ
eukprot:TRINITY_DN6845_c0_g1_i1.p1 TRINITY_DN6845_c0_g1~~TRINITY_DN6845_c0_g1_i1.p1  ORF type:complete len:417 (+),score=72.21 TRINITY_DN6845_c0_g1_i1:142-1392(+)